MMNIEKLTSSAGIRIDEGKMFMIISFPSHRLANITAERVNKNYLQNK